MWVFYLYIAQLCAYKNFLQFYFLKKFFNTITSFVNKMAMLFRGKFKPTQTEKGCLNYFSSV
jgi:hypothetical protein